MMVRESNSTSELFVLASFRFLLIFDRFWDPLGIPEIIHFHAKMSGVKWQNAAFLATWAFAGWFLEKALFLTPSGPHFGVMFGHLRVGFGHFYCK